jgi:hypothetical protein
MYTLVTTALLALSLSPILAAGQECEALKSGSPSAAIGYLRHTGDDTTAKPCVDRAFRQIASAPQEQAISLLIDLLGYKRPLSEGERLGIFMHGDGPNVLYPAVHELYALGEPAEPALLRFVAGIKDAGRIDRENALFTLLLIHHGNAMDVVEILTKESNASGNDSARARLQAAARDAAKWCDDRIRVKCEDIQK